MRLLCGTPAAVHPRFVHRGFGGSQPHIWWKMSIDLSRPVVRSEGNLDPYDGCENP